MLLALATVTTLYIGDSHSTGCFGRKLDQFFRNNAQVRTSATCGSSTRSWLKPGGHTTNCGYLSCTTAGKCSYSKSGKSASLEDLLKINKPETTVVALGSNMLKSDWNQTMSDVIALIRQINDSHSRCVWIGPPQAATHFISIKKYEEFRDLLKVTVTANGCRFVDSADKTDRRKITDSMGLHYNCREGETWATLVAQELR